MKIEVLYPEICNLYGDLGNIRYLQKSRPELEVVETDLKSRPAFLDGGVDLVYVGSATERGLRCWVEALTPYRDALADYVDAREPHARDGQRARRAGQVRRHRRQARLRRLGLLATHAEYHMLKRHSSFFLGKFQDMDIVGFKSVFGHTYPDDELSEALFRVERGVGRPPRLRRRGLPPRRADGNVSDRAAAGTEPAVYEVAPARAGRKE